MRMTKRSKAVAGVPREPASALVDATLPLDERIEGLGIRLVRSRVPHDPGPFAPGLKTVRRVHT
jgi:hypothetical protein